MCICTQLEIVITSFHKVFKLMNNNILSLFLSRKKKIYTYSNATNIFHFANIALKWENFFQKSFLKRSTSGGTILLSAAYYDIRVFF